MPTRVRAGWRGDTEVALTAGLIEELMAELADPRVITPDHPAPYIVVSRDGTGDFIQTLGGGYDEASMGFIVEYGEGGQIYWADGETTELTTQVLVAWVGGDPIWRDLLAWRRRRGRQGRY